MTHIRKKQSLVFGLILVALFYIFYEIFVPVSVSNTSFVIGEGESLSRISLRLSEAGLIRSPLLFRTYLSFLKKDRSVGLGEYLFNDGLTLPQLIKRLTEGVPDKPLVKFTIPEGTTVRGVANVVFQANPNITPDTFLREVSRQNAYGKLYPDTYFFLPSSTSSAIVSMLEGTYNKHLQEVENTTSIYYESRNHNLEQLKVSEADRENYMLTLASIVQGEASDQEDMYVIAAILWKRLLLGMPLQVDVAKETYTKKGLPKLPINNPSVAALQAVYTLRKTDYLYYITGTDGLMHYAKTFDEHKKNIQKYLR